MGASAGALSNMFLAASGAQAAAGVASTYMQTQALRAQGRYARQTAEEDALLRELQVKDVQRAGDRAAALRGLETRALIGKQRASAAGQGVDVGSATVRQLTEEAAAFGAMDVETIVNNAWRQAWGLKAEAAQVRRGGRNARDSARFQARMTAAAGGLQFGRDLLQGAYLYDQFGGAGTQDPGSSAADIGLGSAVGTAGGRRRS